MVKQIAQVAIVLAAIGMTIQSHIYLTGKQQEIEMQVNAQPLIIPSARMLSLATAGFEIVASDLYWIKVVQYVGGHVWDELHTYTGDYIDLITQVQPQFRYAYEFGIVTTAITNPQKAVEIGRRGMKNLPKNRQIPLHVAFTQYYHLDDIDSAIQTLTEAEEYVESKAIQATKGALLSKLGKHEIAYAYWNMKLAEAKGESEENLAKSHIAREQGFLQIQEAIRVHGKPQEDLSEVIYPIPQTGSSHLEFVWRDGEVALEVKQDR